MSDDFKDEIRDRAGIDAISLYRVGTPTIGETFGRRWNASRDSGGLGTGVYAFTTREAAESNIKRSSPGRELVVLENALSSPVRPADFQATVALNDMSRELARAIARVQQGETTFREEQDNPSSRLKRKARTVLFDTPELSDIYGFDRESFIEDAISAAALTKQDAEVSRDRDVTQPLNRLLWPDFDGVAPRGEAGESGAYGAVIFKEKVDECVGRETVLNEEIPGDTLNDCFRRND